MHPASMQSREHNLENAKSQLIYRTLNYAIPLLPVMQLKGIVLNAI